MKKHGYTLLEMLVAIAVAALLTAIAAGAYSGIQRKAMLNRAAADCAAIQLAIKNFEAEYTYYPNTGAASGSVLTTGADSQYRTLIQTLTGVTWANTTDYTNFATNNRKKIKFLDLPQKYSSQGFLDPWGKEYQVAINSSGSSSMTVRICTSPNIDITTLSQIAVFTREGESGKGRDRFATSWGGIIERPELRKK